MPLYEYHCSSCEALYECFETVQENLESPTPHCSKCDPEAERETTLYKFLGNCRPAYNLKGTGLFRPGWQ